MKYILSHPRLTRSAKPLALKIESLYNDGIDVKVMPSTDRNDECIIRFGNSQRLLQGETNYNSPEMIRLAGNKLNLSEFLDSKDFEQHIRIHEPGEQIEEFPIVLREELNRGGGIGIRIIEDELNAPESFNDYWSCWYDFKFELGVHILGGKIVRVFKKLRNDGLEEEKFPIRNTQRGYKFSLRDNWRERYTGLEKFVNKLYEIIPIQFARLDVGYDRESGGYRLIEINSAPDLSQNQNTLNIYAKFLYERIFNG